MAVSVSVTRAAPVTTDDELMRLCVDLLKEHYPKGLTIKQMAQLLLSENHPAKSFCRSSTVLSTKLNSWYRRCSADSEPKSVKGTCPIARFQSPDSPHRLLYKYVEAPVTKTLPRDRDLLASPPLTANDPEDSALPPLDSDRGRRPQVRTPSVDPSRDSQDPEEDDVKDEPVVTSPEVKVENVLDDEIKPVSVAKPLKRSGSSSDDEADGAALKRRRSNSPLADGGSESPDGEPGVHKGYNLRRVIKKTPHAFTPPVPRRSRASPKTEAKEGSLKAEEGKENEREVEQDLEKGEESQKSKLTGARSIAKTRNDDKTMFPAVSGFNPYYDHSTIAVYQTPLVDLVTETCSWINDESMESICSPEDWSLDDLDAMFPQ